MILDARSLSDLITSPGDADREAWAQQGDTDAGDYARTGSSDLS
jgi:hypothetical protein